MASDTFNNEPAPTAPGAEETPAYTLFVTNVPSELEKDGVKDIFSEFGHVTGYVLVKNKNQAFISYSSYTAAERAIHELHQKLPLKMNLQFQDKKLRSLHKPATIDLSGPVLDHRYNSYDVDFKNMKKSISMGKPNCTPNFRPDHRTSDDDILYPCPGSNDPTTFNPYDGPGPYYNTNLMYTRGITRISKDGQRQVSCGRGYTYYNLPEPHYNIPACLQKVYEKREYGHYEFASEDIDDEAGKCQVCSSPTSFRCQRCSFTFYCNRTCQKNDWPNHKLNCQPLPPLVRRISNLTISENDLTNGLPEQVPQDHKQTPTGEIVRASPKVSQCQEPTENKESPPMPAQQNKPSTESPAGSAKNHNGIAILPKDETKNGPNRSESFQSNRIHNSNEQQTSFNSLRQQKQVSPNHDQPRQQQQYQQRSPQQQQQRPEQQYQKSPQILQQQQQSRPQQQQRTPYQQQTDPNAMVQKISDDDIRFEGASQFLPRDRFVDVIITNYISRGMYWVQRADHFEDFKKFKAVLAKAAEQAKMVKPEVNVNCVLQHEGEWYRAKITSISDNVSEVFLYDYGIVDQLAVSKVFHQTFSDYPYFARRICLVDAADESLKTLSTVGQSLSVQSVSVIGDGSIVVQAKPAKELSDSVSNGTVDNRPAPTEDDIFLSKLTSLPNVLDELQESQEGCILKHAKISQNEYNVSFVPTENEEQFNSLVTVLAESCIKMLQKNPSFKPNVGDFICGENESKEWYRGIVSAVKPIVMLAVIDECRFFAPVRYCPLPEGFDKLVSMGLVCQLESNTIMPDTMDVGMFKVLKISKDSVKISIESPDDSNFKIEAQVKKWVPIPEQKGIRMPTLVSGNKIIMTHFVSANKAYVKIDESSELERCHLLEQEVSKCARSNPQPLTEKPVVGEMVLSSFESDGNFYRAVVTKVDGDRIMVKYIDYGNDEERALKHLFKLTDSLKSQKAGCAKITLKGIDPNTPLTPEASDYYQSLIASQASLICTFEGYPIKDGVILKTQNHEIVNDVCRSALEPSWKSKKPENDRQVYSLNNLPVLKIGDVGDELKVIVLSYYEKAGNIVVAPDDENAIVAIHGEMLERIQEYIGTVKGHYIPRDEELCIAMYCDCFYRGLCIDSVCSPNESTIFFIDYGNTETVKHTDIRQITPDFLTLPALGTLCNMESTMFPEKLSEAAKKAIPDILPLNEKAIVKIVGIDDDGSPNIEVPIVRLKLTEMKLI
ncbi:uncharacterized protein LOC106642065 [Copidosoma floridanum]|uniref:uncharacterized protein LOC106642065 n=1 Tax=Copidosoma floridanum TaxID=29053 RepID=UPI0006C992B6|nr:uncharacterized protein LOC106642065 [Copidosoma floridanum]